MTDIDEGTRAIMVGIVRQINDIQETKLKEISEKNNKYLDSKFSCLEEKINKIITNVNSIDKNGCKLSIDHIEQQKEKEKKTIKLVTFISISIPTVIMLGNWIKGMIIGWIQKPHN